MGETGQRIGYLGRILPALSETFVTREITALRQAGVTVKPFSIFRPDPSSVHREAEEIQGQVEVLNRPANPLFWLAHFYFAFRHPRRYFGSLWRYVLASGEPFRSRMRALQQFLVAPFAALRFRRAGVEHIHAHFAHSPGGIAMMAARLLGITFSMTIHSYDLYVEKSLLPQKLASAAFIATVSEYNVRNLTAWYPQETRSKLHVVRCGVDPEIFVPRPQPRSDKPVILGIGRLVELKGFHTLIEAVAILRSRGINVQCYIAGEGPEKERLEAMSAQLGLEAGVHLLGKVLQSDLQQYFRRAAVFALPSCVREYQDNIPVVLIEAMAMEIPVVSTNISAIPELVRDGSTGLLVEPENPTQLADALATLLTERESAVELGRAARKLVSDEFNVHVSAGRLKRLFEACAGVDAAGATADTESQ
ncbi:MAG TPA: glycosyltransferase [Acidobacteriota bacterium]|nr:glycosyltransferase [Acidobacteriota bacterium]